MRGSGGAKIFHSLPIFSVATTSSGVGEGPGNMHLFRLFCLGMDFLFWHFSMCLFCRFFVVAANVVVVVAVALAVNVVAVAVNVVAVGVVIDVDVIISVGVNVVVNVFISGNHAIVVAAVNVVAVNVVADVNVVAAVCNHNLHVLLVCLKCIVLENKIQLKHKAR